MFSHLHFFNLRNYVNGHIEGVKKNLFSEDILVHSREVRIKNRPLLKLSRGKSYVKQVGKEEN